VSGLAPRALKDSVRPRRSSGVVVRPLNFTVRSHLGETQRCEEQGATPFGAAVCELQLTGSSCGRLRSVHPSARAAVCDQGRGARRARCL
jgi:hypothetical protein